MSAPLTLRVTADPRGPGATTHLALRGELDLSTVGILATAVDAALGTGARHLVLDLGGLVFVDGTGLHALADADARARGEGRGVSFVHVPEQVRRCAALVGLDDRLPITDGLSAAGRDGAPSRLPASSQGAMGC